MTITLSDQDAQTLLGLLKDRLPALRFEAARTNGKEIRHILLERQELCERLLDELTAATSPA